MKRVYPAHAYGHAPRAHCYWPGTVDYPDFAVAQGELRCDVAIVGAGFTGLSAALKLAREGEDTVVLDAETPGWGASGRNGGFCCLGGAAAGDLVLTKLYGEDGRREFRQTEIQAVDNAKQLIASEDIACDTHSEGETLMAHTPAAFDGFEAYAEKIERDYGVTPKVIPASEQAQNGMKGPFFGALTNPIGFALNPMKFTLGLARAAARAGARVYRDSAVHGIETDHGFVLSTKTAKIRAKRLIIATNGYSSEDVPGWMRGRYLPTQSNVVVTREMTEDEIAQQGWTSHQMCFDDRFLLHYFRLMPNNRMLFGMRGGLRSSAAGDRAMHRRIRDHFETMFPSWAHVETPFSWHGLLSISSDLTPYAGPIPEMPGAATALSYHGNGVSMASYSGGLLADIVRDRTPTALYPSVMRRPPKRFALGRFRRACLWPLYAWASLTGA